MFLRWSWCVFGVWVYETFGAVPVDATEVYNNEGMIYY